MNKVQKLVNEIHSSYYSRQLRNDQWRTPKELRTIQFKKLKAIIKHAYDYVPYYHRLLSSANVKPEDITDNEDLRKIPLTSKQDLQRNYADTITRGLDLSRLSSSFTSGSSGLFMKFFFDNSHIIHYIALAKYIFFECGVKLSDNFVTVWGRESTSISWANKYQRLLGSVSNTTVPLFPPEKLVKILQEVDPDVISTFPSVLSTLAEQEVSQMCPRLIFTLGEMVTERCRDLVKDMFNSELFETYGSVEFDNLAFECTEHSGLHVPTDGAYIEFLDENGESVSSGEQGEIIVTGLCNYAMPLVRYRMGDLGIPANEKCSCGRSWPLIKCIQGRVNDYLVLPSSRKIAAGWLYFERIIAKELKKNVLAISEYQIAQERKDKVTLKIVKGRRFDPITLETIKSNLEKYFKELGEPLDIATEFVEEIPRGRTGKKKDFVSLL